MPRVLLIDRGAAALAASPEPAQREHPIAEIAKLRDRAPGQQSVER
jgi:hypothetical protein